MRSFVGGYSYFCFTRFYFTGKAFLGLTAADARRDG